MGIVEADPPVYIGDCCIPLHSTCIRYLKVQSSNKELSPNTIFIWVSIFYLVERMVPLLHVINYFENNHDDGTVTGILSHLNARQERSNDRNLIHRHIGRRCINYVLVFALFAIIFLVEGPLIVFKIQTFVAQRFGISHTAWNNTSLACSTWQRDRVLSYGIK